MQLKCLCVGIIVLFARLRTVYSTIIVLGTLAELREENIIVVMSVCLSA
jgi:hypothetical protein